MRVKLEDVCKRIYAGGDVPKDRYSEVKTDEYSVPIYANAEKDEGLYGYTDKAREKELSITVAARGTIGFTSIRREPFLPVVRLITVVPDTKKVSERYLYYVLKNCKSYSTGTSIPQLTVPDIKKKSFELCNIHEQEEIADRLDKANEIIQLRKKELQLLEDLIKARFVEMFDLSKCAYKSLGECTDFVDYRGHTPELSEEGTIRMINAKSVGKGFFKYVDEFITEKTYDSWMHRGFGCPGDILFVTEGHTFGNTCLIPGDMTKFALGQRVITIKGKEEIKNAFLCSYMQTDMFWKDINVYRTGGTAQGIRSKDLVKVTIPIPPIEQQKDFVKFVHQVDKSKLLSLIKLLEQLITYLYNVFIIYRQDKGEEVENHG